MVKVATYFAMTAAAFVFWQSMDKVHVWIALHQDEKQERLEKEAEIKRVRQELLQQARQKDSLASNFALRHQTERPTVCIKGCCFRKQAVRLPKQSLASIKQMGV